MWGRLLGQVEKCERMTGTDFGFFSAGGKLFGGELANRLEHAVARLGAHSLRSDQAVLDEHAEFAEHISIVCPTAHRLDLVESGAAHEDRQPLVDHPLGLLREADSSNPRRHVASVGGPGGRAGPRRAG